MSALGMAASPWVVLAVPACVLIGAAFARGGHGPDHVHALVVRLRVRAGGDPAAVPVLGHLLPAVELRRWAWVVQLSPLYHGVALVRAANFGELSWSLLGHVGVLVALGGRAGRRRPADQSLLLP